MRSASILNSVGVRSNVSPELQPDYFVHRLALRREQDDRDVAVLAHLLQHLEPAHPRQHDVEHHEIQTLSPEDPERLGPVLSRHYPVTLRCQYDGRDLQKRRIVIDQQDRFVQSDSLHPQNLPPASTAPATTLSYPIPVLLRNSNRRRKTCKRNTKILY